MAKISGSDVAANLTGFGLDDSWQWGWGRGGLDGTNYWSNETTDRFNDASDAWSGKRWATQPESTAGKAVMTAFGGGAAAISGAMGTASGAVDVGLNSAQWTYQTAKKYAWDSR